MHKSVLGLGLLAASVAVAAPAPPAQPLLKAVAADVSEAELRTSLTALVGFGTRHTLSDTQSPKRGIGAARRWTASRFNDFSKACGGCLTVMTPAEIGAVVEVWAAQTAELAVDIAGKILEREVTQEDHQRIIDSFFDKVG